MKPVIFGLSGPELTDDERTFFKDAEPCGYIIFGRNIVDRAQLRALTDSLRELTGNDALPILIDQEGGRVSRMKPPIWPAFPAGQMFGDLYRTAPVSAMEAARTNAKAIALTLAEVGITVDCLPLLDVQVPETHPAIGDRSFGHDPMLVAALGRSVIDGLRDGGVVGVVKHMPGQGRATVDSHLSLPVVAADVETLAADIAPFAALHDAPMGMTSHVLYPAWDAERCSTMSPTIIDTIIRGEIGFQGFLMSDDLDMKALKGEAGDLAATCVAAGCDAALNCWGRMAEMISIAAALPDMSSASRARLDRAMRSVVSQPDVGEIADLLGKRDALLALA